MIHFTYNEAEAEALKRMQAEGYEYSKAHGWYDVPRTWKEEIALLHSEASEALDAYRQWGTEDVTRKECKVFDHSHSATEAQQLVHKCKPEGVGSELADVLIRLLDTCQRHNYNIVDGLNGVGWTTEIYPDETPFGDMITDLHGQIQKWSTMKTDTHAALVYTALCAICYAVGIDLHEEYARKYAFNQTRPYRHGNKRL